MQNNGGLSLLNSGEAVSVRTTALHAMRITVVASVREVVIVMSSTVPDVGYTSTYKQDRLVVSKPTVCR